MLSPELEVPVSRLALPSPSQSSEFIGRAPAIRLLRVLIMFGVFATILFAGLFLAQVTASADEAPALPVVSGRIADSDAVGIGGIRVVLQRVSRPPTGQPRIEDLQSATSAANGSYSITLVTADYPGDYYRIVAMSPFNSPYASRTEGPLFRIDGRSVEEDMTLEGVASVSGSLRDHKGQIAVGSVSLYRVGANGILELTAVRDQFRDRFSVSKVPAGEYLLQYEIEGQPAQWWPGVASSAEAEHFELTEGTSRSFSLTTIEPAVITGGISTADGTGDRDGRVIAHLLVGGNFEEAETAFADDAGRYELRLIPGRYALEFLGGAASAREFTGAASLLSAAEVHEFEAGNVLEQDVVLKPAASLAGRSSSRRIVVFDRDGRIAGTTKVDYTHEYHVSGLQAGTYTVRALDGWDESEFTWDDTSSNSRMDQSRFIGEWWPGVRSQSDAESVDLGEGEEQGGIDFVDFDGAEISGTVRVYAGGWMPIADAVVTAVDPAGQQLTSITTDLLGGFKLVGVRPGNVRLQITPRVGPKWYWPAADTFATAGTLDVKPGDFIGPVLTGLQATVTVPVITGTPTVGETLTASATSPIPGAEITYTWNGVDRTGPTFVVTQDMAESSFSVTATANKAGYTSMSAVSARTLRVLNWGKPWFGDGPDEPAVGVRMLIRDAYWSTSGARTVARQWYADGVPIPGATSEYYTPTADVEGKRLTVRTTGRASGYADGSAVSDPTLRMMKPGTPTISGVARVGSIVKVDLGDWTQGALVNWEWRIDGDWVGSQHEAEFVVPPEAAGKRISVIAWGRKAGYGEAWVTSASMAKAVDSRTPSITGSPYVGSTLTVSAGNWGTSAPLKYQWYANGAPVANAKSSTFKPTSSQIGAQLSVRVYIDDPSWTATSKTSALSSRVALAPVPVVSGTARVGGKLSAVPGTWTKGTVLSYQWYVNGVAVSGATAPTYTLPSSSAGKSATVKVTGRLSGYPTVTQASVATLKVLAWATPSVSGTPRTGGLLTANTGSWSSGTSFSYQWYADGVAVSGATGKTFVPSSAQVGKFVSVRVTGRQAGFGSMAVTSKATSSRVALAPVPVVSGTARVGGKLSAVPGTWTKGTVLSYQWYVNGVAVSGATTSSYVARSTDVGAAVRVAVTGRLTGYPTISLSSTPTGTVVAAGVPTISGDARVGEMLVAAPGDWSGVADLAYQWLADGTAIAGATEQQFEVSADLLGAVLSVRVTGVGAGVAVVSADSSASSAVTAGDLVPGTPSLALEGTTLTADPGSWTPTATFEYRWYRDGELLAEAGGVIDVSGREGRYRVEVVGTAQGYTTVVASSLEVDVVTITEPEEPPAAG